MRVRSVSGAFCLVALFVVPAFSQDECPFTDQQLCQPGNNPRVGAPRPNVVVGSDSSDALDFKGLTDLAKPMTHTGDQVFFDSFEDCIEYFEAWPDSDGDSWGAEVDPTVFCNRFPHDYVLRSGDCNDFEDTVFPGHPELCDGLDNNCNTQVDDGTFQDSREPNGYCNGDLLATVNSNQTITISPTVFPYGDNDYYEIFAEESDNECECCDLFCFDEDYELHIELTVPAGAGSYYFCTGTPCQSVNSNCQEVLAGNTAVWIWTLDGACPGNDSYTLWVRIYGDNAPGHSCKPYTLSYQFTPGCP